MIPPTSIDGTDITGATIDGTDVTEITVDGQTVFTAGPSIPDSADLHAHYDFSLEDGSAPVPDQTPNGFDLTGSYSGIGRSINGVQAGEFSNDSLSVSFTAESQPNTIAMVAKLDFVGELEFFDGGSSFNLIRAENDGPFFNLEAGSGAEGLDGASADTNVHVFVALFDGTNSLLRIDGSQFSGDAGSNSLDGVTLGSRNGGGFNHDGLIGECLVYTQDKSSIFSDIENYLGSKWGITV